MVQAWPLGVLGAMCGVCFLVDLLYGIPVWLSFLVGVCGLMIFIETILIFME